MATRQTPLSLPTTTTETTMSDATTIRISLSDHVMLANTFDGGEFERLWPNAVEVPTRRRNSQTWDMTIEDAKSLLGYITGCPAFQGPRYADCDPRETQACRRTAKTIETKIRRVTDKWPATHHHHNHTRDHESQGDKMNQPKHTLGPWQVLAGGYDTMICAETEDGQVELATVHSSAEYQDRLPCEANAALIAAAPQLLEALQKICGEAWWSEEDHMGGPPGDCPQRLNRILFAAREALAAAGVEV